MTIRNPKSEIRKQLIVGLVGQVCAGKSTVAEAFRKAGALVYDADKAVRELYSKPEVVAEVKEAFGSGVIDLKGGVDRKKLAAIVFAAPEKLELLTAQIIFPRTGKAIANEIARFKQSNAPVLLLDAPTLFESGRDGVCEKVLFVAAPLERRQKWAAGRGWSAGELEQRESRLMPEGEKRKRADASIENSGSLADVEKQVNDLLTQWGIKGKVN